MTYHALSILEVIFLIKKCQFDHTRKSNLITSCIPIFDLLTVKFHLTSSLATNWKIFSIKE